MNPEAKKVAQQIITMLTPKPGEGFLGEDFTKAGIDHINVIQGLTMALGRITAAHLARVYVETGLVEALDTQAVGIRNATLNTLDQIILSDMETLLGDIFEDPTPGRLDN